MPIGGERPDPPKSKVLKIVKSIKDENKIKLFFKVNWDIFIIFILIILGSNFHLIFPNMGVAGRWYIYLFGQQLFGASTLFTFLYWRSIDKEYVFKKSLSLGIFLLSVLSSLGEGLKVFGNDILDQANKGFVLLAEYAFMLGITIVGIIFFYKDKK